MLAAVGIGVKELGEGNSPGTLEDITSNEGEWVIDVTLEDITFKEEKEKTLDNDISDEEEGIILDYDDCENEQNSQCSSILHKDFLKGKHCIIQIHNEDNLCFARALVVARAYVHKKDLNTDIYVICKLLVMNKSRKMFLKQNQVEDLDNKKFRLYLAFSDVVEVQKAFVREQDPDMFKL
uniref:Uncharacterized protein n=1 Tax=Romanomermis culicivorax TaxID=13658 RepID=A0A915K7P4_ROMCU